MRSEMEPKKWGEGRKSDKCWFEFNRTGQDGTELFGEIRNGMGKNETERVRI